jgi:hydroxymethylpyrimidine pyrophosphatase-like HAD family hydrolase
MLRLLLLTGEGLRRLCAEIGVPIAQAVAFGDGENDMEMLKMAGIGVAMANARPAAKDAADVVLEVGALLC